MHCWLLIKKARTKFYLSLAFLFCCLAFLPTYSAFAASNNPTFIRDAEIEYYLHELATPIFKAAGLDPAAVNLLIIKDNALNAFVAGGLNIFFYTGLLQKAETPEELQGVIAHETGHIEGGHLLRGQEAMENASAQAIIGMLAGIIAGMASGRGDIAMGTIGSVQSMTHRLFLRFSRSQEASADAAAMRYLTETGQSTEGLLNFMSKLKGQELLPLSRQSEYVRTHPLSTDRIHAIERFIKEHPAHQNSHLSPSLHKKHQRMKAKLLGYLHPQTALLRFTDKHKDINARYARTVALYRTNKIDHALTLLDTLLKQEPNNPFFIELKAQILFETGKVNKATTLYSRASALRPDSALLRQAYGHALLEKGDSASLDQAIKELTEAGRLEQRSPRTWRFLATAWGRKAKLEKNSPYQSLSLYGLAEEAMSLGKYKVAERYADLALQKLKKGSPYWLRAQDIKLTARNHSKD